MAKLKNDELIRYHRHLVLDDFGVNAQLKLKQSRVLVVGAGGLGCPVLLYLAAAGVSTIGIVDNDIVSLSNLQRQVLYTGEDVAKFKTDAAVNRLAMLNPNIRFNKYTNKISKENALTIAGNYDVIVDASDNFPTRYLLNDVCVLQDKPLVYGSILKFEGHIAVFNYQSKDGTFSANYRDLFTMPPDADSVPNCEQSGVLGVLPGMVGSMQANEAIKIITGVGEPIANKLLIIDALSLSFTTIALQNNNSRSLINGLVDYEDFCGINRDKNKYLNNKTTAMKEITVQELQALKESGEDFQLIDVREPHEYDICNLDGELIPMSQIPHNVEKISKDKKVVVHCRSGKRSGDIVLWLEKNQGFENLYNLKGGILAWANEIDSDMPTY